MKTTVIVTTYNRPDALASVVQGFFLQEDLYFDLIIADDGSDRHTRDVISKLKLDGPFEISHVWHEDLGFRAAAIRNKAIKASQGDYIIFTDGDCFPRKNFVSNQIDSLDLISIIMIIEKELKIKISENKLSGINNFKELEKLIKKIK